MDHKNLRDTFNRYLCNFLAKDEATATAYDKYRALAYTVRSELMKSWILTQKRYYEQNLRRIYFLSPEYILGKSLYQNMLNLSIENELAHAVKSLGFSIDDLYVQEDDFMLGNGSDGRQAACLLEAMATQGLPALAYGIRYDYAQFQQEIRRGHQVERPNDWLQRGHPWEVVRPEYACDVRFGGQCSLSDPSDPFSPYEWKSAEVVHAVPYDVPVVGYRNQVVNTLRLWSSWASEEFLPDFLNHGDYERACEEKSRSSRITQILLPDEDIRRATDLRMKQQYFFICATIQDIVRRYKARFSDLTAIGEKVVVHLEGSRCALAIPEFMRILVDEERLPWLTAWEITRSVFAYTSRAVSREDSENWPVYKVEQLLPRHMQMIYDINQVHLDDVRKQYGEDTTKVRELSLIEEGEVKRIRFADVAVLGSRSVSGVSREQTDVLTKKIFAPFAAYFPERFSCKLSGVGQRRWLLTINRPLSQVITKAIGDKWVRNPELLANLEKYSDDRRLLEAISYVKQESKNRLAARLRGIAEFPVDEQMMFDVQTGKIHTNKRQILHILYILHCYLRLKNGETLATRRLHLFAGKAAPSDFLAKQIIHLISAIADRINNDPQVNGLLRVVFVPNFTMNWAEVITPAADLSEQLSTAMQEPSGTFAMKFALNGAVTIASQCGSNIELAERIGSEHLFVFGQRAEELAALRDYHPGALLAQDARLSSIMTFLEQDLVPKTEKGHAIFPLLASLRDSDRQFVMLDFDDYVAVQERVDQRFRDSLAWSKTMLSTVARAGYFSSDRLVREYASEIWKVSTT